MGYESPTLTLNAHFHHSKNTQCGLLMWWISPHMKFLKSSVCVCVCMENKMTCFFSPRASGILENFSEYQHWALSLCTRWLVFNSEAWKHFLPSGDEQEKTGILQHLILKHVSHILTNYCWQPCLYIHFKHDHFLQWLIAIYEVRLIGDNLPLSFSPNNHPLNLQTCSNSLFLTEWSHNNVRRDTKAVGVCWWLAIRLIGSCGHWKNSWPNGQRINSTRGLPREWDMLDFRLCCHSAWELLGTDAGYLMVHWSLSVTPGLSVTATNTDSVTLDRIRVEAATPEVKTQLTARMRDLQFHSIISQTPLNPNWFVSLSFLQSSRPFE